LKRWPLPKKDILSIEGIASPGADGLVEDADKDSTFANVLRSKGTAWLESEHLLSAEWSHAGRHLGLKLGGPWWATLPRKVMRAALSSSGDNDAEENDAYKAELAKFEYGSAFGDRRQEIVFIGTNLDTDKIKQELDNCLVTDEELETYMANWDDVNQQIAADLGPLRFDIGTRVECNVGADEWAAGIIVKQFYRQAAWPVWKWARYQVLLDNNWLIFAPEDGDHCVRLA
jgi:hypothetical protein